MSNPEPMSRIEGAAASPARRRPELAQSLRVALVLLCLLTVCAGSIEVGMVWMTHQAYTWLLALYAAEGCGTVLAGALAWDRRPGNRTGALLCVLGIATLASAAGNVGVRSVAAVGSVLAVVLVASLLHVVLAYPSGTLGSPPARVLVVAGYAVAFVLQIPQFAYGSGPALYPTWGVRPRPTIVSVFHTTQLWAIFVVLVAACAVKVREVRGQRRDLGGRPPHLGVFAYGVGTLAYLAVSALVAQRAFHISALALFATQMVVFAWIPVVYGLAVLQSGFSRTGHFEQLGAWLSVGTADLPHLRNALAATVGDPSISLVAAADLPSHGATGEPAGLLHPARGSVRLEGIDGPLAVVTYDRTLIGDPDVVRSASRLVAVAMERQRLSQELLESQETLRESRSRIVEVADQERRRLAQDLHDVLQSRLILCALHAGRLAADVDLPSEGRARAVQLRSELEAAITDLRHQVQGLMPAMLIERGLPAAIEELADRLPLPTTVEVAEAGAAVPSAVATTGYFIVAEAFTNSLKHAGATELSVCLRRDGSALRLVVADNGVGGARAAGGSGLRGIADRVEALDGTVDVHSPEGWDDHLGRAAVRVVIGEDEALLRSGLQMLLEADGIEVAAAVADADQLVAEVGALRPDVVLTDIRMPPGRSDDGLRAALRIRAECPGQPVMVLSQFVQRSYAIDLLQSGPDGVGYQLKQRIADVDRFCGDLRTVASGGTSLDHEVVALMVSRAARSDAGLGALTARQRQVLALIAEGRSNTAIATELGIGEKAVVAHASNIYEHLGLPATEGHHRRVLAVLSYLSVGGAGR